MKIVIANPPNIEKPAAGEKVIEKPVTEVELQTIRLHVAEAETAAATARSNLLERQRELAAVRQSAAWAGWALTLGMRSQSIQSARARGRSASMRALPSGVCAL